MIFVLDACAMIAYLHGERGGEVVNELLHDASAECVAHAVNLCEVYYDFVRRADERTAWAAVSDLLRAGVAERTEMDREFWRAVGRLKSLGRISLADCFGIALAGHLRGELVTADRHEMERLAPLELCALRFIR